MSAPIGNTGGGTAVPPPSPTQGDDPSSDNPGAGKKKGLLHRHGKEIAVALAGLALSSVITHPPALKPVILWIGYVLLPIFRRTYGPGQHDEIGRSSHCAREPPVATIPIERLNESIRDTFARVKANGRSARERSHEDRINPNPQRTEP